MRYVSEVVSVLIVIMLVAVAFHSAVAEAYEDSSDAVEQESRAGDVIPGPFRELDKLVSGLLNATGDTNDTDGDRLPDSVEWVIGTDSNDSDSDNDMLDDHWEVFHNMNPNKVDSNDDGLADYFEVDNVTFDLDGDGFPNAWDSDNDGDGVRDAIDSSPNARTGLVPSLHLDLNTSGQPLSLYFELRTKDPRNMRLINQQWDWPHDVEDRMQDLDDSTDDLTCTPNLIVTAEDQPDQASVADYGICVEEGRATLPLFPVWDLGDIVALKGKMFYPADATRGNLSMDIGLIWSVTGNTDERFLAYQGASGNFISVAPDDSIATDATELGANETLAAIPLGDGNWSFRGANGKYMSVQPDDTIAATAHSVTENEVFLVLALPDGKTALKASNGRYVTETGYGGLAATATTVGESQKLDQTGPWIRSHPTSLAIYPDSFSLTGFVATEEHGVEASLLYGPEDAEIYAADLLLAYEFLHNASNDMADVPSLLDSHDLEYSMLSGAWSHMDEASNELNEDLYKTAVDSIPPGGLRPITNVMEIRQATLELSELGPASGVLGDSIAVELDGEQVITTRTLRTMHYRNGAYLPVDLKDVVTDMMGRGLDDDGLAAMVALLTAWDVGQQSVVRIGVEPMAVDYAEAKTTIPSFIGVFKKNLKYISTLFKVLKVSTCLYNYMNPSMVKNLLGNKAMFESGLKLYRSVAAATKPLNAAGTAAKAFKYLGKVLLWVGVVVAIGAAVWACVAIGNELGWSGSGTGIAISYAMLELGIALLMIGLALLGPVGLILAVLLTLIDLIVGWATGKGLFERLIGWLVEKFVEWFASTEERTTVDLEFVETNFTIDDKTNNGLTVGDTITFKATVNGIVAKTEIGDDNDRANSYIMPRLWIDTSWGHFAVNSNQTAVTGREIVNDEMVTTYELTAITKPRRPMINFPMSVGLNSTYRVFYDDCWEWFGIPDCSVESYEASQDSIVTTRYYDVMPATIDDFSRWRAISSNDHDGDGLSNAAETDTNEWAWDTDGDGLGDNFERQIGSDPTQYDTDKDGFDDLYELQWGLNFTNQDSDGDGLNDFAESGGWVVDFTYYGTEFFWHVQSDPRTHDTDGDGVSDYLEYWCLLNPMSFDSDGDGYMDRYQDYWVTDFTYHSTLEDANEDSTLKVEMDDDGYTYLLYHEASSWQPWRQGIHVYDPNGTLNMTWSLPTDFMAIDFDVGSDDHLYFICRGGSSNYPGYIKRYTWNGTLLETLYLGEWEIYKAIAVDTDNGHLYLGGGNAYLSVLQLNMTGNVTDTITVGDRSWALDLGRDGFLYAVIGFRGEGPHTDGIAKIDPVSGTVHTFGSTGNVNGTLDKPSDVAVDSNGYILVADHLNDRIQKFDHRGKYVGKFNTTGSGNLTAPISLCVHDEDRIYVLEEGTDRVHGYGQTLKLVQVNQTKEFVDTDGDGMSDQQEEEGWEVTTVNATNGQMVAGDIETYTVRSDPMSPDTDEDGLTDLEESNLGSDPRSIDTDRDGIRDQEEHAMGTNVTHCDSEGDGLLDGVERTFQSDPMEQDTDGEGLSDLEEFIVGSHPLEGDSDGDGLTDAEERDFDSNPIDPDEDGDLAFDLQERAMGTSSKVDDSDGDGLVDGHEMFYRTNATSGDTDGDGLGDGYEVSSFLDPTDNDTDGDGLLDGDEMEMGYNPRSGDSDGDGIPDALDVDNEMTLEGEVVVVHDDVEGVHALVDALSSVATVRVVTVEDLVAEHAASRYILLVGMPDGEEGSAGALISDALSDTGTVLELMRTSASDSMAVRYGLWNNPQTVVMLSRVRPSDSARVLGVFKSMAMDVSGRAITVEYLNPRSCMILDQMELVRGTDSRIWAKLDNMETFSVSVEVRNGTTVDDPISEANGLGPVEVPMDKYWAISVSENIQDETGDEIKSVLLELYYTVDDLDRTGDGDADDPADLDEGTLVLYVLDGATDNWTLLSPDQDWVTESGVNTTDVTLFGREYAGHMRAIMTHLSTFSIAGRRNEPLPIVAATGGDLEVKEGREVTFDGTGSTGNGPIVSYAWTFELEGDTVTLEGAEPVYTFKVPGEYEVTLTVMDYLGKTDETTFTVTVKAQEDKDGGPPMYLVAIIVVLLIILIVMTMLAVSRRRTTSPPVSTGSDEQEDPSSPSDEMGDENETPDDDDDEEGDEGGTSE